MHVTRGRGRALPLRSPAQRHRPDDSVSKLTQLLCATLPESEFPPPWMMRGEARPPPEPVVPCEVQALLEGPRMAEDAAPALASLVREHFPRTHARHQLAYGDLGYDLETCGRTREARILAESGAYRDPPEARRTRRGGPTPTERRPEGCYPGSAADGPGVPFAESRTACRVAEVTRESCPLALFAHAHTSSRGGQQVLAAKEPEPSDFERCLGAWRTWPSDQVGDCRARRAGSPLRRWAWPALMPSGSTGARVPGRLRRPG